MQMIPDKLPRMNDEQLRKARTVIREHCCNLVDGICIVLDCDCVQRHSYSLLCKHFRYCVLPNAPKLEAAILGAAVRKRCSVCGAPIYSRSNRAKYCPECAKTVHREIDRKWKRNHRSMSTFRAKKVR